MQTQSEPTCNYMDLHSVNCGMMLSMFGRTYVVREPYIKERAPVGAEKCQLEVTQARLLARALTMAADLAEKGK